MNAPASRPAGVSAVAVVLLVGSLFLFYSAGFVLLRLTESASSSGHESYFVLMPPGMIYLLLATYVALAAWSLTTAIGLMRMKPWARISALAIAGLFAFVGIVGGGFAAVMWSVIMPPVGSPEEQARVVRVLAVTYGIPSALGAWWLIYLLRPKVRAAFASQTPAAPPDPHPLPVSIVVVGWYLLATFPGLPLLPLLNQPAFFFGQVFWGWRAATLWIACGIAGTLAGWGLLKKNVAAYWLAAATLVFGLLNLASMALFPNSARLFFQSPWAIGGPIPITLDVGYVFDFALAGATAIGLALPLYFLLTRKQKYLEAARGGV